MSGSEANPTLCHRFLAHGKTGSIFVGEKSDCGPAGGTTMVGGPWTAASSLTLCVNSRAAGSSTFKSSGASSRNEVLRIPQSLTLNSFLRDVSSV